MTQTTDGRARLAADPTTAAADLRLDEVPADTPVRVLTPPARSAPRLTVVVPTRNEEETVGPLLGELGPLLAGLDAEILVVDDSDDDTPAVLAREAAGCPVPVRLLHREPGRRRGGLASAVVAGARHAARRVGPRHGRRPAAPAGGRRRASHAPPCGTTRTSSSAPGTPAPGSGDGLDGARPRGGPRARHPARQDRVPPPPRHRHRPDERPVRLPPRRRRPRPAAPDRLQAAARDPRPQPRRRASPRSAYALRAAARRRVQGRRCARGSPSLRHLARLRRRRPGRPAQRAPERPGRAAAAGGPAAVTSALVGLSGVVVNTAVLWFLYHRVGLHHLLGRGARHPGLDPVELRAHRLAVYRGPKRGTRRGRAARFVMMNNLLLLGRLPVFLALVATGAWRCCSPTPITLVALFLVRFVISDRVIYGAGTATRTTAAPAATRSARWSTAARGRRDRASGASGRSTCPTATTSPAS